jgi:hypothetical protein
MITGIEPDPRRMSMRSWKVLFLLLPAVLLLGGCASRIGYPAKTVGIPTPVTLFTKAAPNGSLVNTMSFMARDIWNELYKKHYEEILTRVSGIELRRQLDIGFSNNVAKATELFAPSSTEVFDIPVDYDKARDDKTAYSGFDFSSVKDTIPTQYVLALTLDEWGLIAAQRNDDNGPFVSMTMQLIDKETNMSAWKYHYKFQQQVSKESNDQTDPVRLQHILEKLIEHSVNQYFLWLSFK